MYTALSEDVLALSYTGNELVGKFLKTIDLFLLGPISAAISDDANTNKSVNALENFNEILKINSAKSFL